METKEEVLKSCTVHGLIVKLPEGHLDRKLYQDVAKSLNLIGGAWKGGKVMGFEFKEDPSELLTQIQNGDKRNLKKEFQFFGTPSNIADKLVNLADINSKHVVLEPSAGQGAIIEAIYRAFPHYMKHENDKETVVVDYWELMPINVNFLANKAKDVAWSSRINFMGYDFLSKQENPKPPTRFYDRIIANPPFSKNQDIDHILKMYECLKPGGRLVSIASIHWKESKNKKETEFRAWLKKVKAKEEELPSGTFKESGTMTKSVILVINKK